MGTQAIVSIANNGKTVVKTIAGCNGYNARKLETAILSEKLRTAKEVYEAAKGLNFGCHICLVVMSKDELLYAGTYETDSLYRDTFDDPRFNPRWENGTADYVIVIDEKKLI
jgi:hypothetical protein